jgi:hypothetical protein
MAPRAWIDGTEVTDVVLSGSVTRRLNLPSQAQVKIHMEDAIGGPGSKLKIAFDGTLYHHGTILVCETDAGEDDGYTVYNSSDPLELWQWRPARDSTGDFSKPEFMVTNTTGPAMIEEMFDASENPGLIPTAAEGPLFLEKGVFATGGVDLRGAPVDWPMTMAQVAALLVSTGEVDIVITPTDPGGGIMGRIDVYNGNFGADLSASVSLDYGMGNFNVRQLRWNEDMTTLCNKLWYYGGPRVGTAADPAGDQHWCFNITRDDPGLADPPQSDIVTLTDNSRATYGVRMEVRIFDAESENCRDPVTNFARELYRRRWQIESWLRAQPKTLVHVTPVRVSDADLLPSGVNPVQIGDFDIGDLVTVRAGSQVKGGFAGVQRIYEYTLSWDADGVVEISELQTSPNQEGAIRT